jgi:type I restriction enzyme S subunit
MQANDSPDNDPGIVETRNGPIPKDWPIHPLGDLAEVGSGVTLGRDLDGTTTVELPYLRVENVQAGFLDLTEIKTVKVRPDEVSRFLLQPGDVLMTEGGDFDKLGRGCIWPGDISPCLHQNHIFRVRAERTKLAPEFLSALIGSEYGRRYFLRIAKQTTNLATINKTQLRAFPVPCPPLDEQRAIARILDVADAAIERTRAIIAKARWLKEGLVQDLFSKGIGHTRFRWSEIGRIPASWDVMRVGDALTEAQYGLSMPMGQRGQYPILRMAAIQDGEVLLSDLKYIDLPAELAGQYLLRRGDVLFNRTNSGELVGKVGIYRSDAPAVFASYLIRLKVNPAVVDNYFLGQLLASYAAQCRIKRFATPGVQQVNINASNLQRVLIALPQGQEGLREQQEIAEILEKQDQSVRDLEKRVEKLSRLKRGLMQDLLTGSVRVNGQHPGRPGQAKAAASTC